MTKSLVYRTVQSRIQLKARQRAARKRVEERREALHLVQRRKAAEQQQAAIKIQAAAKRKHARVSDEDLLHIRSDTPAYATQAIQLIHRVPLWGHLFG